MMKKLLLTLSICFTFGAWAQTRTNSQWVEIDQNDGVKISMKYADCQFNSGFDERRILLKFENLQNYPVSVSWDTELYHDGNCHYCDDLSESNRTQNLDANASIEGECVRREKEHLYYIVKFLNSEGKTLTKVPELSDFELLNITVTKL